MSLVVAIKKDGIVYMGTETQATVGYKKLYMDQHTGFKIHKYRSNVLVGLTGSLIAASHLFLHEAWFDIFTDKPLSKALIITSFLPTYRDYVKKMNMIKKESDDTFVLPNILLIAKDDKLFKLYDTGSVIEIDHYAAIGSGQNHVYALFGLEFHTKAPYDDIKRALNFAHQHVDSVSGDFVFIDTKGLTFIKEEDQ